jgi:hypothetical protein
MTSKAFIAFTVLGLLLWTPAQSEVIHRQFSEDNLLVMVRNDTWQPDGFEIGLPVPAVHVERPGITIDGRDEEPGWSVAEEVIIPLDYGDVGQASVKALYSEEAVFIRVRWADGTMDREHHPWVWNAELSQYVVGPQAEDSLLLSFEAGCEWNPSILAGYQFDFDGWHWLAARSDPVGQAWDMVVNLSDANRGGKGTVYESRHPENTWILKFDDLPFGSGLTYGDWKDLNRRYLYWPKLPAVSFHPELDRMHVSDPSEHIPAPSAALSDTSKSYPQFRPVKLEGSAGEVAAKGHWEDGYWTVEFRRDRITPDETMNDTVFNRLTQFSIHVFNGTERIDQSSESRRLFLQFLPKETHFANK